MRELTGKREVAAQARGKGTLDKHKQKRVGSGMRENGKWKMADETPTGGMFAGMKSGFVSVTALACALEEMEADEKRKEEEESSRMEMFGGSCRENGDERATAINKQLNNSEEPQRVELVAVSWLAVQGRAGRRKGKKEEQWRQRRLWRVGPRSTKLD